MTSADSATGMTDLHSHLIPGVDDGAATIEDALEGIGRMVAAGIRSIVTTPHLDGSLTRDPAGLARRLRAIDEAFHHLARVTSEAYPELELARGCEILLDRPDPDLSDPGVRMGETSFVLIEWPRLHLPPGTTAVLKGVLAQGVQVLIAHPERYAGYDESHSIIPQWREEGAILQMNYGSLVGRYGQTVRARAVRLLEAGWVDCFSTDFHGRPSLGLFIDEAREAFEGLGAEERWELLTRINPGRIARGERPLPVPPFTADRGVLARLRALFLE